MAGKGFLDRKATATGFAELVGISQPAVSKHIANGVLTQGASFREWLREYCEHLREYAAGRGGGQHDALTRARTEESSVKSALGRIQYNEKIGTLVPADDAGRALEDWAGYANREYLAGVDKLVNEIQSAHEIQVDSETVQNIAESTARRIAEYAGKLGGALAGGSEALSAEEAGADDGVDTEGATPP